MPATICLKGIVDRDIVELDESFFECGHVRVSIFRFLGQHAFDDVAECGGQISAESSEGWWQFSEMLDGDGHWIFTGERGLSGEHVPCGDSEGVLVRAMVEWSPFDLLGAHVPGCPHGCSGLSEIHSWLSRLVELSESEVGYLCDTGASEENIFWFDVAVDNSGIGSGLQCGGDLLEPAESGGIVRWAVAADPLAEVQAGDVFLNNPRQFASASCGDDLDDIGVTESSGCPCFLIESAEEHFTI